MLPVTVVFRTQDGTAGSAAGDFLATTDMLTFAPGEVAKTVSVTVVDDPDAEGTEDFSVLLEQPTVATIADDSGRGTILDNDRLPVIDLADGSALEDDGLLQLTVTLDDLSGNTVLVDYRAVRSPVR